MRNQDCKQKPTSKKEILRDANKRVSKAPPEMFYLFFIPVDDPVNNYLNIPIGQGDVDNVISDKDQGRI